MHIVLSCCTGAAAHLRLVRGHGRATAVTTCGGQDFVGGAEHCWSAAPDTMGSDGGMYKD